ncbi:transposase family protein, partial [Streptomyces sp. NPDC006476]|uniref:transposase family protein n=1 Tax=Streptomyces sp. NPDC006476 TaxID=3157175 RepID=UPI0033AF986B
MIKVLEAFDQNRGRVRVPSSLIGVLQRHCQGIDSACPDPEPQQFTSLAETLSRIPDPCRVRGRRYHLGSLLALCLVADTDSSLREQLGLAASTPNASTLGRLLARLDGDALDVISFGVFDTLLTWESLSGWCRTSCGNCSS